MKSLAGRFLTAPSARGCALLLVLLLGAGFVISACGEDDGDGEPTPPTTPTPPPPAPTPAPATPSGLAVSMTGADFLEWSWTAVSGATGYQVQFSTDESFTDADPTADRTTTSYRQSSLATGANGSLRVRAFTGTGANRVFSDWSTHVTGTTAAAGVAPTNLRISKAGADFIEWSWNAVAGAAGYQAQYATNATFTADVQTFILQGSSSTTQAVRNLDAGAKGYLRVRAWSGSLAAPVSSPWTSGVEGATDAAATGDPIAAPTNVRSTSQGNNSIGVAWNEVDDADVYEVQFRARGATSWSDAECGGNDNEVDEESCLATDLEPGTAYEFRVRAIPASSATGKANSEWVVLDSAVSTSGRRSTPTTGGSGALDLTWSAAYSQANSDASEITIVWDRIAGARYDYHYKVMAYDGSADSPCEEHTNFADYTKNSPNTAHVESRSNAHESALFCVRTVDSDNPRANLSHTWVITPPEKFDLNVSANAGAIDRNNDGVVEEILWDPEGGESFNVRSGFDYEFRAVEDPVRVNAITSSSSVGGVQRACANGTLITSGDTDVNASIDTVSLTSGLDPFTGYLLCMRYSNTSGQTNWRIPEGNKEYLTNPGAPATPAFDSVRSANQASSTSVTMHWNVQTRGDDDGPRLENEFEYKAVAYRDWTGNPRTRVSAPRVAICRTALGGNSGAVDVLATEPTALTTLDGIRVTVTDYPRPFRNENPDHGNANLRVCVRASWDSSSVAANGVLKGPWVLSGPTVVAKPTQ